MDLPLEYLVYRLNKLDGVEAKWSETDRIVSIEYEGTLVAEVYASISINDFRTSNLLEALGDVPMETRMQIGWEVLMYRLSL